MIQPHNIYIHVPFCASKCKYCAFFSSACANPDWYLYTAKICDEIKYWGIRLGKISVPTVFFGGGTPSLMPTDVFDKIMSEIRKNFNITNDAEITLESNPGTLNKKKLSDFISAGVNRLSVGVQRLDDKSLKFLGRVHDVKTARNILDIAQQMDIRLSADFIYGLPGDTVKSVMQMCRDINSIGLKHCSMYELTIEENTPLGKMNLNMPTNDEMADMYNAIDETLILPRYEVSNYAAHGDECRHNQNIWDGAPYIGIGRGAAGRIYIDDTWYEQMGAYEKFTPINSHERATEILITGMRTTRGIKLTDQIKNIIDIQYANTHPEQITIANGRISATKNGMLILDDLLLNLVK